MESLLWDDSFLFRINTVLELLAWKAYFEMAASSSFCSNVFNISMVQVVSDVFNNTEAGDKSLTSQNKLSYFNS